MRSSSRSRPLKLSTLAFCGSFPGSIKCCETRVRADHSSILLPENLRPLSDFRTSGKAPRAIALRVSTVAAPAPVEKNDFDCNTFSKEIVDDRQRSKCARPQARLFRTYQQRRWLDRRGDETMTQLFTEASLSSDGTRYRSNAKNEERSYGGRPHSTPTYQTGELGVAYRDDQ